MVNPISEKTPVLKSNYTSLAFPNGKFAHVKGTIFVVLEDLIYLNAEFRVHASLVNG